MIYALENNISNGFTKSNVPITTDDANHYEMEQDSFN